MRIAAAVIVVVALILAGGVGYLLYDWLSQQEREHEAALADAGKKVVEIIPLQVVVATKNLPAGKVLESTDVDWRGWPEDEADDDFITQEFNKGGEKIDDLTGWVTRRPIMRGDPVTYSKLFQRKDARFMSGILRPGMRAVTLNINAQTGSGGFIKPGDHVDVLLVQNFGGAAAEAGQASRAAETILRNVRVLASDQDLGSLEEESTKIAKTITLEVSPKQAEVVAVARTMGNLSLVLRSISAGPVGDTDSPFTTDLEVSVALSGGTPTIDRMVEPLAPLDGEIVGIRVLGASRDLPAGSLLRDRDIRLVGVDEGDPAEGLFLEETTRVATLRGALVLTDILAGEPLTVGTLIRADEPGFLAEALGTGMRAVTVQIGDETGLVAPGDRVDVIHTQGTAGGGISSDAIIQDVRVLKVDDSAATATIEVSERQANTLRVGESSGSISLALRSSMPSGAAMAGDTPALSGVRSTTRSMAAARDLPAGTLLRDSDIQWVGLQSGQRAEEFFVQGRDTLEDMRGALVRRGIVRGQPIPRNLVVTPEEPGFLAAAVTPGMRAVSFGISNITGVGGLVAPGDDVDVVLTGNVEDRLYSETILRKVKVLSLSAGAAVVEVTPKQLEKLAVAQRLGQLLLALRSDSGQPEKVPLRPFTSDLEVSQALSGGPESLSISEEEMAALEADESAALAAFAETATQVLVANRDLEVGHLMRASDYRFVALTGASYSPAEYYLKDRAETEGLIGALVIKPVDADQPLPQNALIGPNEPGFLAAAVPPGRRAVSIGISNITGVGGLIAPGDHVDVVLTSAVEGRNFSETILENVRILTIAGNTATIEVSPKELEKVAVSQTMGQLLLALRSETEQFGERRDRLFTSDLEVSRALSGGVEAVVAAGGAAQAGGADAPPKAVTTAGLAPVATRVLVARRDLEPGTLLRDADFKFDVLSGQQPRPGEFFVRETTDVEEIRGALVLQAIAAGEPLPTASVITPGEPGFLAAAVGANMRGVSIGLSPTGVVGGQIAADDMVDVVLVARLEDRSFSETILEGVRVLSVLGTTATVEVTPKQSEKIAVAQTMGTLLLTLRGAEDDSVARADQKFTSDLEVSRVLREGLGGGDSGGPTLAPVIMEQPAEQVGGEAAVISVTPQPKKRAKVKVYRANEPLTLQFSQ